VILAKVVIDTTGHADIAVAAGADFAKGRTVDGLLNEMDGHGLRDPTNVEDISRFTMKKPPSSIGLAIRESRRIIGDHVLTFDEAIHGKRFPDVVCRWRSNYDTHFRHSAGESELSQNWSTIMGLFRKAIEGGIPYRSLTPKGLDNILVAGKAYSVNHDALIAARMQPDLQHLGEAAGVAAALASRLGVSVRNVPIRQLQSELVELGVLRQQDLDELLQKPPAYDLDNAARLLGTEDALQGMVALYLSGEQAISALRPLLEERNADIRLEAGLVLGMLGDDSAAPVLLDCLNQKNGRTFVYEIPGCSSRLSVPAYYSAVILLGRLRVKTAVPLMIEMLQDPQTCPADLASYTIEALEQIGDPAAAPAIRPYLRFTKPEVSPWENEGFEATWGVRLNAAKALASLDDLSGVPVLIELLDSDLALVRDYAQRLLGQITGRRFGKGDQTGRH
jgi:HEAT repeat protein